VNELSLIIDHVSLSVEDLGRAKNFYSRALAPLGMQIVGEVTAEQNGSVGFVGFGIGRKGSFWVAHNGRQNPTAHICFRAPTRAAVRDFHAAALGAGAKLVTRPRQRRAASATRELAQEDRPVDSIC